MRTVSLLAFVLAASCGRCTPTCGTPAAPPQDAGESAGAGVDERLTGIVQDERGSRSGVRVRLFALTPAPNTCPDWMCAESLAQHRRRLPGCPAVPLAQTHTSDGGAWQLAPADGGTTLVAEVAGLGRWQAIAGAHGQISLQLEPTRAIRVTVEGKVDVRAVTAAAFFESGWCVPLRREGNTFTADGLPNEEAMVLVEAPDLTPVEEQASVGTDALTVTLRPGVNVSETCTLDGAGPLTVRWTGTYETREVTTDAQGSFRFEGMLATEATVECLGGDETWILDLESGTLLGTLVGQGGLDSADDPNWEEGQEAASCRLIEVIDQAGAPVEGASVLIFNGGEENDVTARHHFTDARGRVCKYPLLYKSRLTIHAPSSLGGSCAGSVELTIPAWDPQSNVRPATKVVLPLKPRARAPFRGRVADGRGTPVARARVVLSMATWPGADGEACSAEVGEEVETRADGTFELKEGLAGQLTLVVTHPWFAHKEVTAMNPSRPAEIVLSRGASWSGRALGPDAPLAGARLALTDATGRADHLIVPPDGAFSFRGLSAGEAKLRVRLADDSPLGRRGFEVRRALGDGEALEANVTIAETGIISGRLANLDGGAFTNRFVQAVPDDGTTYFREAGPEQVIVAVGPDGQFVVRALRPGSWRLRAASSQGWVVARTGATDVVVPTSASAR